MTTLGVFLIICIVVEFPINVTIAAMIIVMSENYEFKTINNNNSGGYLALGILSIFFGIITSTIAFFMTNNLVKNIN